VVCASVVRAASAGVLNNTRLALVCVYGLHPAPMPAAAEKRGRRYGKALCTVRSRGV